jgi:hypothetical protein
VTAAPWRQRQPQGVGQSLAAAPTARRTRTRPAPAVVQQGSRVRRVTGVVIDVLVGLVALADGCVSVIGEPERVVVWSIGSAALVVSVVLLIVRHRREPDLHL